MNLRYVLKAGRSISTSLENARPVDTAIRATFPARERERTHWIIAAANAREKNYSCKKRNSQTTLKTRTTKSKANNIASSNISHPKFVFEKYFVFIQYKSPKICVWNVFRRNMSSYFNPKPR